MLRVAVAAVLLALLVKVPAYSLLGNAIRHGRRGSVGNGAVRSAAESSGDGASPTIININMENAVFVTAKSDDSPSSVLRKEKAFAKSSSGGGASKGFGSSGSSGEAASEKKGARSEAKRKVRTY